MTTLTKILVDNLPNILTYIAISLDFVHFIPKIHQDLVGNSLTLNII